MERSKTPDVRRVAIYGRVSTEHEAQLSAFENQQAWYENEVRRHPDWVIVERYYDEGITGTAAKKRPAFMKMMEEARQHRFNLIVTREVCRFARNTVDALNYTRELKDLGIEVYFIQDNIWTMNGDGELRLSLMATLAQEESRKISERVLAGQQISREKGVLYGTGNILGYDRINGTYVVNPEQAYTVNKVFELYAAGYGYRRICEELTCLGCKNAHGLVEWKTDRIGRMLRNATYKGYIGYNKSHSTGYLSQKRVNHSEADYMYIKGDFEPIVTEELWNRCEAIRKKRSVRLIGPDGKLQKYSRKEPGSVWTSKLRCSCGSSFRRFLWRQNADGTKIYGYECYRQKREVSRAYLKAHGLDDQRVCMSKSIPSWHIDLMALKVFQAVWGDKKEVVLLACRMIEECAVEELTDNSNLVGALEEKVDRIKKKQAGLREMRAVEDITREDFLEDNNRLQQELAQLECQISDLQRVDWQKKTTMLDIESIRHTLERWVDFSGPTIDESVIDEFILQVVEVDNDTFNWTLNLEAPEVEADTKLTPSQIALKVYREHVKGNPAKEDHLDAVLSTHITNPQTVLTITVTKEDAEQYCHSIGMRFFAKKWCDKTIIISV